MNEREVVKILADVNYGLETFHKRFTSEMGEVKADVEALSKCVAVSLSPGGGEPMNHKRSGFNNLGEFALSVAAAFQPGGRIDDRLLKIQAAASGTNEGTPSEGGFLVGSDLMDPLLTKVYETGQLAKLCFRLPISAGSNSIKIPILDETSRINGSRFGGVQSYYAAEADTVTATKPKFRLLTLELRKLFAICYATEELMADAPALGRILQQSFVDEIGFKVDDAILNGSGAGMPLGILNSPCLVTQAVETGQTSGILYENIIKMYSRMLPRSRKSAVWLINQSIEPALFSMSLSVGTGGSAVYLPATGAAGQPYASLMGLPVIPCEQCGALNSKGDIILADLSSYILAEKGGIKSDVSTHLRFLFDERIFRWTYRFDGSPLANAPTIPFKGSASLSSFVTLAARA
ncbi:MAG: phage major capsid protein [Deltaproteobacteria bacterium]